MALNRAKVLETADKLVRQGKLEDAIKHYLVLSDDNPRDVNTINRIGDLYVRLRRNKEGIKQFMRIADFYAGDGFHLKAIAMYKKITKLEPAHLEANERLADMYAKQGMTSEARTQLVALAEQCLKSSLREKALDLYGKVLAIEPANVKVRLLVAEIHAKEGDVAEACEGYLAVVAELKKRAMSEEALKVLQKASRLQPSHPEVLGQMAELLQAAGKHPGEALSALESLHKGEPGNQRYLQLLGEAYLGAGKPDAFQKLLATASAGEARVSLMETEARFLASRQETGKASDRLLAAAQEAQALGPQRSAALLESGLGFSPDNAGILEKILAVWTEASAREGMVSALERLAELHAGHGAWDKVAELLDRLQDLAPESAVAGALRPKVEEHRPRQGDAGEASAEEALVPSLDELEKVVELEADEEPLDLSLEARDSLIGDPVPIDDEIDMEGIEEQDAAYSGKSVIQEMRSDVAKPEVDEEFLSEHFTEAEVFLKYGLVAKAREQLQTILDRYPDHVPSLGKMKEVLVEESRKPEAAVICMKVAGILRGKGDEEKASEWEEQARDLDPGVSASAPSPTPLRSAAQPAEKRGVPAAAAASDEESLDIDLDAPEEEMAIDLVDDNDATATDEAALSDRISQLEFSMRQGLKEEAEAILKDLESMAPEHPEVERLKTTMQKPKASEGSPLPVTGGDLDMDVELAFKGGGRDPSPGAQAGAEIRPDDGFFDLAAELNAHAVDSTPGTSGDPLSHLSPKEEVGIDEIFKAFRKKVDQQVEEEDYETRYNLGIAYKEMGLLDEAIGEFQYASRDPKLFLECCSILGICFREKGMSELAVKWYRKALDSGPHHEEKCQGLRYDLGELHAERGEYSQALSLFSEVYGVNSNYREVASKIRELRKRVG
ncbi:MAG TPA: hypothetical protein VFW45_06875 [Candidatus Polarisedimenticolia bacterium]|nr:hypothetical protein [Candidatus Polarisedimenticolia bacterium]